MLQRPKIKCQIHVNLACKEGITSVSFVEHVMANNIPRYDLN